MKYRQMRNEDENDLPLQRISTTTTRQPKTLEAQIQKDDTLQAIALRYHCSVAEIKRINKIDKDNEIFARTTIQVPVNPYTILLPLHDTESASIHKVINNATISQPSTSKQSNTDQSINDIILNTQLKSNQYTDSINDNESVDEQEITETTKLNRKLIDDDVLSNPIALKQRNELFSCSGSDWDISWICLLVGILALCVAIPLIYVVYIAEHPEEFHHKTNITLNTSG